MTFNTIGDLFDLLNSYNTYFIVPDNTSYYDVFIILMLLILIQMI